MSRNNATRTATWRPAWAAGAPPTGRPQPSVGSRLVVVAFALGGQVGTKQIDPNAKGPGESGRMDKILDAGFKQPAGESVLIQNRSLQAGTPAFTAAVDDVVARLSKVAVVRNVQAPKIADDRHAVLIDFDISGDKDTAADRLDPVLKSVGEARKGPSLVLRRRVRRRERCRRASTARSPTT